MSRRRARRSPGLTLVAAFLGLGGLLAGTGLSALTGPAAVAAPGASSPGARTTVVDIDTLPTGAAPRLTYRVRGAVVTASGRRVGVRLPRGYEYPDVLGRRDGHFLVSATGAGAHEGTEAVFALTPHRVRRILSYPYRGRRAYLMPGVDRLLLSRDDGPTAPHPSLRQLDLRTGRDAVSRYAPAKAYPLDVLALVDDGAVVRVGRQGLKQYHLDGRVTTVYRAPGPGRPPIAVVPSADLIGVQGPQLFQFRRLSAPDQTVYKVDRDCCHSFAVSPDGTYLLSQERQLLVVRSTADGAVVSSLHLTMDSGRVHLRTAAFEDDDTYLVGVQGPKPSDPHRGILRCTAEGSCSVAVALDQHAYLLNGASTLHPDV